MNHNQSNGRVEVDMPFRGRSYSYLAPADG
jgi:hypothetical protein